LFVSFRRVSIGGNGNQFFVVGSLFNILNGNAAELGFGPTAAIVVLGYPLCLFLFFAAIQKAQYETEKDDEAYLNNKNKNRYG
jgi:hypothetical protein